MSKQDPFYKKNLIEDEVLLEYFYKHFESINWTSDTYYINGKEITPRRKTYMYGKKYTYSGITKEAVPFDNEVLRLSKMIEQELQLEPGYFNACLANFYPDGDAGLSYHKDDEKEMDTDCCLYFIDDAYALYLINK